MAIGLRMRIHRRLARTRAVAMVAATGAGQTKAQARRDTITAAAQPAVAILAPVPIPVDAAMRRHPATGSVRRAGMGLQRAAGLAARSVRNLPIFTQVQVAARKHGEQSPRAMEKRRATVIWQRELITTIWEI